MAQDLSKLKGVLAAKKNADRSEAQILRSQNALMNAHQAELDRRGIPDTNFGNVQTDNSIGSKTAAGNLTTTVNASGQYLHKWDDPERVKKYGQR